MEYISHHIMSLVGGNTHVQTSVLKQFQETRRAMACGWCVPGLICDMPAKTTLGCKSKVDS